jgi:two-component system, LytTR family, response regulator
VQTDEIIRLQAESNYTHIFMKDNKVFVSAKTLKEYDELLQGHGFLRVHKSHLVNSIHIQAYDRQGILLMTDSTTVEVARRKKEFLQQSLGGS